MSNHRMVAFGAALAAVLLGGCASNPAPEAKATAAAEPIEHEYRTGSLMVQREKHVTTEEERQAAQDMAAKIRAGQPLTR